MPAFNAAPYLRRAVESVLRQTHRDLELIIVDDGSSDDTLAVAEALAALDGRIVVRSQPNAGPGPARSAGFRAASGRLFAFLDSDDEWDPGFLAAHVSILDARPDVDVVIGNARHRGGARHGQPARPVRHAGLPITLAEILADETSLFIMAVFRREVVEAVGGFDPDVFTNEEYDMWIRAAAAGFTFTRHPEPLGWYANRDGSLSSSETRMLRGILQVYEKTRAIVPPRSPERAILERQVRRFAVELAAAEVRESLRRGDAPAAARHLARLQAERGGWWLGAAARCAQHAPFALAAAFRVREKLRGAA
jgi:glycosyltransferase involved in cell wall biosynthesis